MLFVVIILTALVSSAFSIAMTLLFVHFVMRKMTAQLKKENEERENEKQEVEHAFFIPRAQVAFHDGHVIIVPMPDEHGVEGPFIVTGDYEC